MAREKLIKCFSSAAESMKGPPGFFASAAFRDLRWSIAGEQRREEMRLFGRKLLRRLDSMEMPFYAAVGLMDHKTAAGRYVRNVDPWKPMESPFLDGVAIEFRHCVKAELHPKAWALFAEIGFDVARLMQVPVLWGGFSEQPRPGLWCLYDKDAGPVSGFCVDRHTYGVRNGAQLEVERLGY